MGISLARLDNRLLHGIVASQWTPKSGANRVMVIDDKTANTPMIKEAMRMGKPSGCSLSIINKKQHIPILRMVSMMVRKFLLYVMIHR